MSHATRYALGGLAVLALGAVLAADRALPGEIGLTEALNGLPAPVIDALELVMLLGTLGGVVLVAIVAGVLAGGRRVRIALAVLLAGGLAWIGSALVKDLVERPRPASAEIVVRDGTDSFGYPSGHTSIATAALAAAALTQRRSPTGALAAGAVVGAARLAVGVHLPLDVIGGLGLGIAAAVLVVDVVDRA